MATAEHVTSRRIARRRSKSYRKAKSHAFRNGFLILLCLLVALTYFAPFIIANTSLRNWAVQTALEPDGTITLGSASLGWFSPVAVENIDVRDSAGDAVVAVESLRSEKSLISILLDVDALGRLHVVNPSVHLVAHEKDTNLERVFASLLESEGESTVTAELEVTGGTLVIDDAVAKRQFQVHDLAADCKLGDAAEGILLAASGTLVGEAPGSFKLELNATPSKSTGAALANGKVTCQTTALPLELLEPIARRAIDRARLSGHASAQLDGSWGDMAEAAEATLEGEVVLAGLQFTAAALGDDEIHLQRVELPCRIRQNGDVVEIDKLAINCELGEISLSGTAKTSDFSASDALSRLARENYELKGQVDLARLARMLPATLRIREGTQITAGQIEIAASAKQLPSGTSWTGLVETSRLAATAGGRPIVWENPLAIQFALHEANDGITIDRAVCTSSFLQVSAAGSLDNMSASADFDLARLVTELRQFSDLDNVQLAGQGHLELTVKRAAQDQFAANASFRANGFQWITENSRPWTEENLTARLAVNGTLKGQTLARIDAATLAVESGSDRLQAELREAVAEPRSAQWPLACSWNGQLAAWVPRLESCLGLTGWDLAGAGKLRAALDASASALNVQSLQLDLAQLHVQGHGWFVNEPAVAATCSGKLDVATTRIDLNAAKVAAGATVVLVDHAILRPGDGGWSLDGGNAHVEAELSQLSRWRQDPGTPAAWQVSGKLTSDAQLKHADGASEGSIEAAIDRLQIVDAARPAQPDTRPAVWQEQRLTLAAKGKYRHAEKQLQLDAVQVASGALRLDAKGAVAAGNSGEVDVQGTVAYDWEQLAPLWRPYLGQGFQIAGRQTRDFAVRGRLSGAATSLDSWKNVTGQAAVGWTAISTHGLRVGPGDISAQLADGLVRTQPIGLDISEGRLTVSPVARISPSPAELFLPAGPLLTNVRLSPAVCAEGLRFVAPILADATVAEGRFSISLDGGRIPLSDPGAGDVGGRMTMQGNIKPGPIAQEFVGLIKELVTIVRRGSLPNFRELDGALMSIDNSNVEFRMVNRRVYHRGLTIVIGTTPVTTEGSVGLDESLSLVAEVPINARLLGADLSLGALEGKTIKIPIAGTLGKPKLDRRALQDIPRQLLENAARDVLTEGLNKGLEQLFPGRP